MLSQLNAGDAIGLVVFCTTDNNFYVCTGSDPATGYNGLYLGAAGGKVLIPAFALERAQEILRRWDESKVPLDEAADAEDWSAPPEGASCDEPEDV